MVYLGLTRSIVLSRLLPLFEKVGEVLAIIWLTNLASTKRRSYTLVPALRGAIKKSSFTFSCKGFYFRANLAKSQPGCGAWLQDLQEWGVDTLLGEWCSNRQMVRSSINWEKVTRRPCNNHENRTPEFDVGKFGSGIIRPTHLVFALLLFCQFFSLNRGFHGDSWFWLAASYVKRMRIWSTRVVLSFWACRCRLGFEVTERLASDIASAAGVSHRSIQTRFASRRRPSNASAPDHRLLAC